MAGHQRGARGCDSRAEYATRIARGQARGLSTARVRRHAPAGQGIAAQLGRQNAALRARCRRHAGR
jgi:hypothetical protein